MEGNGVELLKELKMGANEIFGCVGRVVGFDGRKLFGVFGVAIQFQEGADFDILFGRNDV